MSIEKQALQKMYKVLANQQKIIHKLAQVKPFDVRVANDIIKKVAGTAGYEAVDASIASNQAYLTVKTPASGQPGDVDLVWEEIKKAVAAYLAPMTFAAGQPIKAVG